MPADKGESTAKTVFKPVIAGAITGILECIVVYPTEYVKTHLQLQDKRNPVYSGLGDCVVKTVKKNGPLGLYQGVSSMAAGSIGKQAARWGLYESAVNGLSAFKRDILHQDEAACERSNFSMVELSTCGFVAGIGEALIAVVPSETIKTKLIDDGRSAQPRYVEKNFFAAAAAMIRDDGGVRGIYRGVSNTVLKQGMNQCVRFPAQQALMNLFCFGPAPPKGSPLLQDPVQIQRERRRKHPIWNGVAGFGAGVVSVFCTQPFDVVKTRMQSKDAHRYKSSLHCWRTLAKDEGIKTFYAGSVPRMVRVGLNVALAFTFFPFVKQLI